MVVQIVFEVRSELPKLSCFPQKLLLDVIDEDYWVPINYFDLTALLLLERRAHLFEDATFA